MYEKLSEKEISFMECWFDPTACTECLFPLNFKAAHTWDQHCECIIVRPYQFAMQNYSYCYADSDQSTPAHNFEIKKNAGTIFNIAARDLGKSLWILIDTFLNNIHEIGYESLLGSCTQEKLKKIADPILNMAREHPFFSIFKKVGKIEGIKAQPIEIATQLGHIMYGRNEQVDDPEPGKAFHGIHAKTTYYEEFSYATKLGSEKRIDSGFGSLGTIERLSGIPDIRVGSPLGDLLADKKNKNFICRLPQCCRPDWSESIREEKIAKYGGKFSSGFKLNVEASIIEGAYGKWDMDRIRKNCIDIEQRIKFFEVSKDTFIGLENLTEQEKIEIVAERLGKILIINRLPCKQIIAASDIGTTGSPSEITINFGDGEGNWKYHYQISLHKLTVKEQAFVFNWIYKVVGSCFISLDCTNADGRAIRDELLVTFKIPVEHLMDFRMNQNLEIDLLKDDKGKVVKDKSGKPLMREENTKEWSIQQLELIFYNGKIEVPLDEKFLEQFTGHYESRGSSGRPSWGSSTEEHLVDTFLLFALTVWYIENKSNQNLQRKDRCIGII